jgi:hypothetical protein
MSPHDETILARAALGTASALGKVCRWCLNRRHELAPGAATFTLTGLSWMHHLAGVSLGEHAVYGLATAATVGLAAGGLKYKNTKVAYAGAGGMAVMGDLWIGAAMGPSPLSMVAGAAVAGGAYAAYWPWLVKSRKELLAIQVKAAKAGIDAEALGASTNGPGLTGATREETTLVRALVALLAVPAVDVKALEYTPFGWQAVVELPPGKNTEPQKVIARREQLAANLGMPGRLRLAKGEQDNELVVSLYQSDPLADPIPWPGPSARTCTEPAAVGVDSFGQPVLVSMLYNHVLIGGASDNGKSSLQNVLVAYAVACEDADVVLIDLKPGAVELGPWKDCARLFSESPEHALGTLRWLVGEVKRRGEEMQELSRKLGKPVKKWVPGVHGPAIFVFIDELAELIRQVPEAAKLLEYLLQVARFAGVMLVCATQSPSNRVFGGNTDGRQQYQVRIGLGAPESTTANLVFGPGAHGNGWILKDLDAPGKFLLQDREHQVPNEARAFWMRDEEVAATTGRYAAEVRVRLEKAARTLLEPEPGPEDDPTPPGPPAPPQGPGGGRPVLRPVPTFPDGTAITNDRHHALWEAIEGAGEEGITIDALVALGLPDFNARSSVNGPLSQWRAKGWVLEAGKQGRAMAYKTAPRQATAPAPAAVRAGAEKTTVSG